MLKPVQRLPQYKLLLEDYLRRINHDSVDFDDTTIALRIVSDAADHANNTIRQGVRMDIFMIWQPCYGSLAMAVLLWQPCNGSLAMAALLWKPWFGSIAMEALL